MFRKTFVLFLIAFFFLTTLNASDKDRGTALFNSGVASYQNGQFRESLNFLTESINIFEKLGKRGEDSLMNAYLWAGAAAYYLENYQQAEEYYLISLQLAEKQESLIHQVNISSAISNLFYGIAQYTEAGDWYIKTSRLLKDSGQPAEARQTFEYGGYSYILAERYDLGLSIFEESIRETISRRNDAEKAWLYAMRGNCLYYLLELEPALQDYKNAVELLEPFGASSELTHYYGWTGKILFDQDKTQEALSYFDNALALAQSLNSEEDKSRILAYYGYLYASEGDYESGAEYYEQSLDSARILGFDDFIIASSESLEWIYEEGGEEEKLYAMREELSALYKNQRRFLDLAKTLNNLGLTHYDSKEFSQAISFFKEAVSYYRRGGSKQDLANVLLNLAMAYEKNGNPQQAEAFFKESLELNLELGNRDDAEDLAGQMGSAFESSSDYQSLIHMYESMLPLYEQPGRQEELMHLRNNIGTFYYGLTDYNQAISYYEKALHMAETLNRPADQSIHLHNIAQSKAALSKLDEALRYYNRSLAIAEENALVEEMPDIWNSLGELYRAWGWYAKSFEYYERALNAALIKGDKALEAAIYNNMGQAYRGNDNPETALEYYQKALAINASLEDQESRAIYLSNMGEAYRQMGENGLAMEHYGKALQIDNAIKNLRGAHIRRNNIALLQIQEGKFHRAMETFEQGLQFWREKGNKREEASALKNLWAVYAAMEEYERAIDYLLDAVLIQEDLRLTAQGAVRREYLDSQIATYRDLASTYYFLEDPMNSLFALEMSRGKYLLEQMGISRDESVFNQDVYDQFLQDLGEGEALLSYTVVDQNIIQAIAVEQESVTTTLIDLEDDLLGDILTRHDRLERRYVTNISGDQFERLLKLYRTLLSRQSRSQSTVAAIREIGAYLHTKLIEPFSKEISLKEHLIIVPDGILGSVPFETFENDMGTYLIERFDISYSQSLVLAQLIKERDYETERKPLLAMGGAVYDGDSSEAGTETINRENIKQNVSEMIRTGQSLRGAYDGLGLGSWSNLPGTLAEVELLSEIVPQSEILTGRDVSEEYIKNISHSGELASYKVLHFATHGIAVPEIPELSAVILSQTSEEDKEDGYLTMGEISELNIHADLVNLSACETGLGKIYQGEGIVGLTQSFLVAGAKALSVSLWQVSDESTMQFMTGVYSLVEEKGLSYAQAMSEMKRIFLKNDDYDKAFFWAPFVYYGVY